MTGWDEYPLRLRRQVAGLLWPRLKELRELAAKDTGPGGASNGGYRDEIAAINAALERLGFPQ